MTKMEKLMEAHDLLIKAQANYEKALEEALVGEEYHVLFHIKTSGQNVYDHIIVDDESEAKSLAWLANHTARTLIGDSYHCSREIANCRFYQGSYSFAQIGYDKDYDNLVDNLTEISF